jgi:hypothetical protein
VFIVYLQRRLESVAPNSKINSLMHSSSGATGALSAPAIDRFAANNENSENANNNFMPEIIDEKADLWNLARTPKGPSKAANPTAPCDDTALFSPPLPVGVGNRKKRGVGATTKTGTSTRPNPSNHNSDIGEIFSPSTTKRSPPKISSRSASYNQTPLNLKLSDVSAPTSASKPLLPTKTPTKTANPVPTPAPRTRSLTGAAATTTTSSAPRVHSGQTSSTLAGTMRKPTSVSSGRTPGRTVTTSASLCSPCDLSMDSYDNDDSSVVSNLTTQSYQPRSATKASATGARKPLTVSSSTTSSNSLSKTQGVDSMTLKSPTPFDVKTYMSGSGYKGTYGKPGVTAKRATGTATNAGIAASGPRVSASSGAAAASSTNAAASTKPIPVVTAASLAKQRGINLPKSSPTPTTSSTSAVSPTKKAASNNGSKTPGKPAAPAATTNVAPADENGLSPKRVASNPFMQIIAKN